MQTLAMCKGCLANRPHHAQGFCTNCYHKFVVRKTLTLDLNNPEIYAQHIKKNKDKAAARIKEQWGREKRIVSELSKERLEELYCVQKMSMGDIAELIGCSRPYVLMLLRKYALPIRTKSAARAQAKKNGKNVGFYAINEHFFKNHTPEMAYVLGFIYSDGNLNNGLNYFSISQKEPEILYKITDLMLSKHPVARKKQQELYLLTIGNVVMIKDLCALGLTPNKSLDAKFPVLANELYPHFIRGYFDGDGSIHYSNGWRVNFVSGSKEFLLSLEDVLNKHAGLSKRPLAEYASGRAWQLTYFRISDLLRLFDYLYATNGVEKGIYLLRKYQLFLKFKGSKQYCGRRS